MSWVRAGWRLVRLLLHTLAGSGLALKATLRRRPPPPAAVTRWYVRFLELCGVRLDCQGTPPDQPALIVANHLSWVDIPAIGACSRAAFLSKWSIRHWPLVGWFARAAGTLFIRRGKGESGRVAAAIAERLAAGGQVAIFPEGRIGNDHQVERFFPRLFAAAIDSGVPVVPMALRYCHQGRPDDQIIYRPGRSFMGILFILLRRRATCARLVICPPIDPDGKDRRALAEAARQAIVAALAQSPCPGGADCRISRSRMKGTSRVNSTAVASISTVKNQK